MIVLKSNFPSSKNPPSADFKLACLSDDAKPLSSVGGNVTWSAWKLRSGLINVAITRLYLEFFVGEDKEYPPIISSSSKAIEADPVVSITNLYLPWT